MSQVVYPHEVLLVALEAAEGFPFERFSQLLYAHLIGASFAPTGGLKDGGADGVLDGLLEIEGRPGSFFQASVREDIEAKIRQTVARLREVGRDVRTLVYFTSRPVPKFDLLETDLSDRLDVTVRIRDRSYIASHVNDDSATAAIFRENLAHYAAHLQRLGSSKLIPVSPHVKSPAVFAFLSQEIERRSGDTSSLDAMVDALILWALEGTDPDQGLFMSRVQLQDKIATELASIADLVEPRISPRLESLAEKGQRLVRWHKKDDQFCLPYETRLSIEAENAADELLVQDMVASLTERLREGGELSEDDLRLASSVAIGALQREFESQGLEFASFLRPNGAATDHPDVAAAIADSLEDNRVTGRNAVRYGAAVFNCLRGVLYSSRDVERQYLRRLSNTYTLLFVLNTEPRLLEFFQDMAGDFYLYVGSDQILKALSEQYLDEEDQMARNALRIAADLGATLVLTEPVLQEVVAHFRRSDTEWQKHVSHAEVHFSYELARNVSPIMLRAYLYARINPTLSTKPLSWQSFVAQFCDYEDLRTGLAETDFLRYLTKKFSMEFVSADELERLTDIDKVGELARDLEPGKQHSELAFNDALLAHAVYGRRAAEKEVASTNEFGFKTWWLTGESSILKHTVSLLKQNKGARYMMRPEFLLHFVTLAPSARATRETYRKVFPTLLGVKLAKRMDEKSFHSLMDKVDEATQMDDARRSSNIASILDRLKGDFDRVYVGSTKSPRTGSIDVSAASIHET